MLTSEHPFWSDSFIFTPFVDFNLSYRIVALATHWRNQMLRGSARGGGGWWRIKWIYYRLLAGWLWNLRKPSFNLRLKLESWSPVSQVPGLLLTSAQLVSDSRPGNSPAPPRPAAASLIPSWRGCCWPSRCCPLLCNLSEVCNLITRTT